jgi:AraC-like DNA-binding protein
MLRQVRDQIDRDYAEPVGIPALAAAAGYSTAHFIRAFHAAYGETPGAYRTRRRVERACELLRSVNLSVTEICHAVGFTSLGSFSARFSGLMGQSPSAYRAEAARRGGPAPIPGCFALMWRTGLPAPPEDAGIPGLSRNQLALGSTSRVARTRPALLLRNFGEASRACSGLPW